MAINIREHGFTVQLSEATAGRRTVYVNVGTAEAQVVTVSKAGASFDATAGSACTAVAGTVYKIVIHVGDIDTLGEVCFLCTGATGTTYVWGTVVAYDPFGDWSTKLLSTINVRSSRFLVQQSEATAARATAYVDVGVDEAQTVTVSKAGAAFDAATSTCTKVAGTIYALAMSAADLSALGEVCFLCTGATNTTYVVGTVVAYDPFADFTTKAMSTINQRGSQFVVQQSEATAARATIYVDVGVSEAQTVTVSKAGGTFGVSTTTAAQVAGTLYKLVIAAADIDTLGEVAFLCTGATNTTYVVGLVVAYDPFADFTSPILATINFRTAQFKVQKSEATAAKRTVYFNVGVHEAQVVTVSKAGGTFGVSTTTAAQVAGTLYKLIIAAADIDTLGQVAFLSTGATDTTYLSGEVVDYDPYTENTGAGLRPCFTVQQAEATAGRRTVYVEVPTDETITVTVSKAGAAFDTATTTCVQVVGRLYKLVMTAADLSDIGQVGFSLVGATSTSYVWGNVVAYDPYLPGPTMPEKPFFTVQVSEATAARRTVGFEVAIAESKTVTVSKAGGAFDTSTSVAAAVDGISYKLTIAAADIDTLGAVVFKCAGTLSTEYLYGRVVAYDPFSQNVAPLGVEDQFLVQQSEATAARKTVYVNLSTAETITVTVSKGGAAFDTSAGTTCTAVEGTLYKLVMHATDIGTLGMVAFKLAGALDTRYVSGTVVAYDPFSTSAATQQRPMFRAQQGETVAARATVYVMIDTAETQTVTVSKATGAFGTSAGSTCTAVEGNLYKLAMHATDLNTIGQVAFKLAGATSTQYVWGEVTAYDPYQEGATSVTTQRLRSY